MPQLPIKITLSANRKPKPNEETLGFGKYFSDHLFSARYTKTKGWEAGEINPYQSFSIDPGASVLHYGQALFEGMKAFRQQNGRIVLFRPEFNWKRLVAGAERLCMQAPPEDVFLAGISELVRIDESWIPRKRGASLYIRPTLIGTEAFLGVRPAEEYLFFVILSPVGSYYAEGNAPIRIWIEKNYLRAAEGGLGATKAAANYAASLKAAHEAKKQGYAQVLWLDAGRRYIEEVGTMNVFFVFENEIVTPELDGNILAGGVRDSVLQLLKKWGLPVVERKLELAELVASSQNGRLKEAFGTGTAAVISPIGEFSSGSEKIILGHGKAGPISQRLYDEILDIQYGTKPDEFAWLHDLKV